MRIHELFAKPIDRPIEGVIKADDQRNLLTEVEEYVVTREVAKGLTDFATRYLEETNANGVWISGFFGSGKSHLLKILSLVLDDEMLVDDTHAADLLLPKIDDELLRGDLQRCIKIPARSVLFNIDQKADAIGGSVDSPVLHVFVKVLNELQGYYGRQGHIAQFEHDLESRGQLAPFKVAYQKATCRTWESDLPVIDTLENETFARVYADFCGASYDEGLKILDRQRENYRVSPEDFARRVKQYLDSQGPDFRLNFFADEVGQFIGQDSKLMLNLQTITESLATICQGRAWVFVTSQGELKNVLGDLRRDEGDDFTKIQGRFKSRVTLTSADVREVIQRRLLRKREPEPEVLTSIYDAEKENLQTLYRFGEGSVAFKSWRGSDEFCAFYPFSMYQFDLFQRAIEQLSRHDAFTGKHTAVGERSMLAVFQEVAKKVRDEDVGHLATFDFMFDGIAASMRGDLQTSVRQAERQLDDPIAVRIVKALFLLKWVREFKPTPRNVAILLIDRPNIDIQQHEKDVREALNLLEAQSYLQRNGEQYEFLTDTEKDIEVEIKNTDIEESQVAKLLSEVVFSDILRDPKIRYEGNGQDYVYARRLDGQLIGREADIAVNVITTEHESHDDLYILAAQNTGKAELLVVLPEDLRVVSDARLYLKTHKYIQQNTGLGVDETRRSILTQRGQQNSLRRNQLQTLCAELLGKAPLFLNGSRLSDIGEGDPKTRIARACQSLISFAYPSLRMLKGTYNEELLSRILLQPDDLLEGGGQALSEAEQEVLQYVMRNQDSGERTSLEEIVRTFGRRPYGWPPMGVVCNVARLFRLGKVELREADLLDARAALVALKNSRSHGGIRVRLQEQFDTEKVNALKRFHFEFFDRVNDGTDPRSVGQLTSEALAGEVRDLQVLLDQVGNYPFLECLREHHERVGELADKDYSYLLNHLPDFSDELLTSKEELSAPIKAFMHGPQRGAYDQVLAFLREEQANFGELPAEELAPALALEYSETPFRGSVLPEAKVAVADLRRLIDTKLAGERLASGELLDNRETSLRTLEEFAALGTGERDQVLQHSASVRRSIESERYVSSIRDRVSRYKEQGYPSQLALLGRLAAAARAPASPTDSEAKPPVATPRYVAASSIHPDCDLAYITSEADLDRWLAALRAAAVTELEKGNRISL